MRTLTQRVILKIRYLLPRLWARIRDATIERNKGVLLYLGVHKGREFDLIYRSYRECYGFEANPDLFALLKEKYRDHPSVKLFNYAVATGNGEVTFNISSNNGASSSLGTFDDNWWNFQTGEVTMVKTITVPSINLYEFCQKRGLDYIDDYISDIQGMDLEVLKTMKPYIDERRMRTITVETTIDERRNIYKDLPDNSESGFRNLLEENYKHIATGFGVLPDYWFADTLGGSWEMDCKWRRRWRPGAISPMQGPRNA